MGKLKNLRSPLSPVASKLSYGERGQSKPTEAMPPPVWKRWYHTARWADLRIKVFVRDLFTCQMCGRLQGDTSKLTADHRRPHRGNPALFWDMDGIQTLCTAPCHVKHKQALEAATPAGMWD